MRWIARRWAGAGQRNRCESYIRRAHMDGRLRPVGAGALLAGLLGAGLGGDVVGGVKKRGDAGRMGQPFGRRVRFAGGADGLALESGSNRRWPETSHEVGVVVVLR